MLQIWFRTQPVQISWALTSFNKNNFKKYNFFKFKKEFIFLHYFFFLNGLENIQA